MASTKSLLGSLLSIALLGADALGQRPDPSCGEHRAGLLLISPGITPTIL